MQRNLDVDTGFITHFPVRISVFVILVLFSAEMDRQLNNFKSG